MPPLVSIITPSYNQAEFIESTLLSVQAQEYPALEHILVDGASTDGSLAVIGKHAAHLAKYISEPDRGQADAINKGFRHARGEIIAWLNSDDLYLPGAVWRGVQALEANPRLGFVFGDALTIDPAGCPLNRLVFGPWGLEMLIRFRIICQPAVFMRRSVFEQAGGLDANFHTMLDHHLWLRMASLAPIGYIGGGSPQDYIPLAAARHHPAAKNVAQPEKFAVETLRLLTWIEAQPELTAQAGADLRQIRGGAYRLAARYLLDGGRPGPALRFYGRALAAWPAYTARHTHRITYAAASVLGLGPMLDRLREPRDRKRRQVLADRLSRVPFPSGPDRIANLQDWPGICLEPTR